MVKVIKKSEIHNFLFIRNSNCSLKKQSDLGSGVVSIFFGILAGGLLGRILRVLSWFALKSFTIVF